MLTLPQRQTILLIWACIKAQTISCPNLFRVIYVITTGINLVLCNDRERQINTIRCGGDAANLLI